jgi:Putative DNA-binding domain
LLFDHRAEDRTMVAIQQSIANVDPNAIVGALLSPPAARRTGGGAAAHSDSNALIAFLAVRFPVIRRLVGGMSFRVVARRFIVSEPLGAPIPSSYGESFPRFLRSLGNAASIEYVADIAKLEMVRGKAQRAADVRPLGADASSLLRAERLNGLRVLLHPSVYLVQSRFPIVTIWEHNRSSDDSGMIERWWAESALVARPFLEVEVRRLPPGGYAFLRALSEGQTVAMAMQVAAVASPKFELASNLALLMEANVLAGIHEAA